jgi:hypothetical protein
MRDLFFDFFTVSEYEPRDLALISKQYLYYRAKILDKLNLKCLRLVSF